MSAQPAGRWDYCGRHTSAAALLGDAPIMVLTPHPDDESLGCGALLAAAWSGVGRGTGAHVVCLSDGSASHKSSVRWSRTRMAAIRATELAAAVGALGGCHSDITNLGCEDSRVPDCGPQAQSLARRIAALCRQLGCRRLFCTSSLDAHTDHKAAARIAHATGRLVPGLQILYYPVWSRWLEPQVLMGKRCLETLHVLDTGPWQIAKRQAICAHRSQRGLVVDDDPQGFVLPLQMIELFASEPELYLEDDDAWRIA